MAFDSKVLLRAATATGAGSEHSLNKLYETHTVQANITGAPTAVTVALEGSLDGVLWFTLASHTFSAAELTATGAMFHVVQKPVTKVRANVTTLTGGTSPTVTVFYHGLRREA